MSRPATDQAAWTLRCSGLSVRRGNRAVLHTVELAISAGECISLIGPNGSGKTTLMLALMGLLPPAAGTVRLDDIDMHRLPASSRGRFASYVPQVVDRIPAFTVRDVVAGGRYPHIGPLRPFSASDREAVQRALEQCGLLELASRPINAISGGERQKAIIAAAVAQDAQLMFLDEPNTALDPAYQVELAGLLKRWHQTGRGLLLISHDLQLPSVLGGRVVALRVGRVVADGPAEQVLQPQELSRVYGTSFETAQTEGGRRIVLPHWWSE